MLMNLLASQNGIWTAALLGSGLMVIERRPIISGMLLGCLVAKPQMALLVPFALLVARRWATLVACGVTAAALIGASALTFGMDPWIEFAHRVPILRHWDLEDGTDVWHFYASVFVSVRHLSASLPVAYAIQGFVTVIVLLVAVCVWQSTASLAVKSAVLVACTPFASPYFQVYDLVVLSLVPLWLLSTDRSRHPAVIWAAVPLTLAPLALLPALIVAVRRWAGEPGARPALGATARDAMAMLLAPRQARGQT